MITTVSGEARLSRPSFMNKDFLTNDEKKLGNPKQLKAIDRSLTKLHDHSTKNWSVQDIQKSVYTSPSNFDRAYNRPQGMTSMGKALYEVLGRQNPAPLNKM